MANRRDYDADKQRLAEFLTNFCFLDNEGRQFFPYADQLTAIAHREQTSLTIELEDLFDLSVTRDLATAIRENTRRYFLFSFSISKSQIQVHYACG